VLSDGEDVAVGVFEPGYFAPIGGGPDAEGLVLDGLNKKVLAERRIIEIILEQLKAVD
jgi:hypothetical protein